MLQQIRNHLLEKHHAIYGLSQWFHSQEMKVYLRAGPYVYRDGVAYPAVGVANVTVWEQYRGQGVFTRFLEWIEREARTQGYSVLRVEQVLAPGLAGMLVRRGFVDESRNRDREIYTKWL